MADDDRTPASNTTAKINALKIGRESGAMGSAHAQNVTRQLRQELSDKGIKGFKRGGRVKKTGVYKLHKGEKVVTAPAARKATPAKRTASKKAPRRR